MEIAHELNPALRVVTLRAPHPYSMGGFAWFELQWDEAGIRVDPLEVLRSIDMLTEEIAELKTEFPGQKTILGGFSQGAIMTIGAAMRKPHLLDGAMSLSGRFIPELISVAAPGVDQVAFLVQHGIYDGVLPVDGSRKLRDSLIQIGAQVEYHEYPIAHEVSWPSLNDLSTWLDGQI